MKTLKTKSLTTLLIAFFFLVSCTDTKNKDGEASKIATPNVILLMGDDHGWDEVGYNGHPFVKTPVLDDMAARGLRFDRFYSGHPSCSPTRGSFMTGRHPNRYGTFDPGWSIRPEEITIGHMMKDAGYATAHFGKWHLGPVKKESPTNPGEMGFDEYLSHDNFFELNPVFSRNGEAPQKFEGESSDILIEEALKFIRKSKENKKPFMAVVWFGSPHEPYSGLPEDLDLYENLPDILSNIEVSLTSNETGKRVQRPLREVLRERYAEITAMDRSIGKLRNYLKESNLKENTLVWYCGDNGTPVSAARTGMSLRSQKGSLYEGGVRVPGILEWPARIKKPASTGTLSVTSDFFPTLAELTGQPLPSRPIDGISLVSVFDNPVSKRTEPLCFWKFNQKNVYDENAIPYIEQQLQEGTTPLVKMMAGKYTRNFRNLKYEAVSENDFGGERSIMGEQYKLILDGDSPNEKGLELYDILNDPGETKNIASEHPELAIEMKIQLRKWQESVLNSLTEADYKY